MSLFVPSMRALNSPLNKGLLIYSGGGGKCTVYLFSSSNTDSLQLGSPFTGNLKVQIAATAETGLHYDIIAGRQGAFVAAVDPVNATESEWVQYEIEAVAIEWLLDTTFDGVITYAKDDVWYQLDMGAPSDPPVTNHLPLGQPTLGTNTLG